MNCEKRKTLVLGIIISLLLFNFINLDWVKGDTITVTFSGITNPSSTHKIFTFDTTDTNWSYLTGANEINDSNYLAVSISNNSRITNGISGDGYAVFRFEIDVDSLGLTENQITSVLCKIEGYCAKNTEPYARTMYLKLYDDSNSTWLTGNNGDVSGTWSHSDGTDNNVSFLISSNVGTYVSSGGYIKMAVATPLQDTGANTTTVYVDYIYLTITYTPSLTAPTLVSPTASETGVSITPDFDWGASTGGASPYTYELMVADNLSFTSPDINATGISDSNYSYTTGLTPNTTYYWKVRTLDSGPAYSDWTSTQSFTTASFVAPTFTMPTSGMSISTTTPTFSWSASTGGDGNYTYELMVSLNSGFTTTVVNQTGITSTSYAMTTNLTPDVHYAKLRAKDGLGNYTDWTSTISFTAVAPSSGGPSSSTSTQEEYVPYTAPVTTNNDTVTTTSTGGSTSVLNKYIINPVKVIFIDPLRALWNYIIGLFHFSGQDEIIDIMKTPVGVDEYKLPLGVILAGALILILSFGDGIKMPKFKLGKRKRRKGKR